LILVFLGYGNPKIQNLKIMKLDLKKVEVDLGDICKKKSIFLNRISTEMRAVIETPTDVFC